MSTSSNNPENSPGTPPVDPPPKETTPPPRDPKATVEVMLKTIPKYVPPHGHA